jgi:pimeloyl-ACP methyl ester carboxylesterase
VKPFFLGSGGGAIAAIFQPATAAPTDTAVLIVPPFGWDDQTSYRPRRNWSSALASKGFASLRIDLPGTGDSSGSPRDTGLVDSWIAAVGNGIDWLRNAGADRVAVIALGAGGLLTLQAMARGSVVDDLVLWGMPATGRALIREVKAFARIEQFQTGAPGEDVPVDELCAGGHLLAAETIAALSTLDAAELLRVAHPARALVLGRDGMGPDNSFLEAVRGSGADVGTNPGRGWGEALERAQSKSPSAIFETVNSWLAESAQPGAELSADVSRDVAQLGAFGERVRETPVIFDGAGRQLFAVVAEPIDAPIADGTIVLFNAGAIRRIGPNRMWTEASRRWAALGVPVIRLDLEGIGDAGGDSSKYATDDGFYTQELVDQARSALQLAEQRGLPDRFLLAGLCSGAWWSFELALADPRVVGAMLLNPRLLAPDPAADHNRELRKLARVVTRSGLRNMLREKHKLRRASRLVSFLVKTPRRVFLPAALANDILPQQLQALQARGQHIHFAFSGDEPLHEELRAWHGLRMLEEMGVTFHQLPHKSHTLKPLKTQQAAHAILDEIVRQSFNCRQHPRETFAQGVR